MALFQGARASVTRLSILAIVQLAAVAAPATAQNVIGGRYCGLAQSGGRLVETVTVIEVQSDGLLRGAYEFADIDGATSGTLQEFWKLSELQRTLIWTDKYGIGNLAMQFEPGGDAFKGLWGSRLGVPDLPWDGKRCDAVASKSTQPSDG